GGADAGSGAAGIAAQSRLAAGRRGGCRAVSANPERPIRVLIVDDEYPARAEMRYHCGRFPDVEIIGEAATAREALHLIENLEYDVVFLDIAMPGVSGI